MNKLLPVCLVALLPASALATAQCGEYLVYQGQTNIIFTTPLESHFSEDNPRPDFPVMSTACWRGYIGVWKIESNTLYLVSLQSALGKDPPLDKVFPKQTSPIPATWFSDVLRVPRGKRIRYVHMAFGTVYEKDVYITVEKGKVTAERVVDNRGAGATRSTSDLQWVALADKPVDDDGLWCDGRLLYAESSWSIMASGTTFLTRGVFISGSTNTPARLWIPETPTTESRHYPIEKLPEKHDGTDGSHVEIRAHFVKGKDFYDLHVDHVRPLKPGETIHHPDFKPRTMEVVSDNE